MPPAPEEAEFAEDIIEEILLRLPIESLIRFKSVSKQWFRLITSPRFGFRQHSIAQAHTFGNPRRASFFVLRIADPDTTRGKDFITPVTVFVRHEALRVKINPNIDFPHIETDKSDQRYLHVLFPAGFGFYCLFEIMDGTALLWNPTTQQTKVLPPSPFYCSYKRAYAYNFGKIDYKDGNFSYKLGRVISKSDYFRREGREEPYKVTHLSLELFSSKTKSWKLIPDFCTGEFCGYPDWTLHSANLKGKAHWVIRSAEEDDIYITTFDYETEVLSRIKAPLSPEVGNYDKSRCIITLYDGKFLCLVLFRETNFLDIWVMREYGVEDSWTKEFTVKKIPMNMEVLGFSSKVQGIFLRPTNEVDATLLLYDCNSSTIKRTLHDVLEPNVYQYNREKAINIFRQIVEGVSYMHEKGIAHNDLNPNNIFFVADTVKIGDFGLATFLSGGSDKEADSSGSSTGGPTYYIAPEGRPANEKVDIYSLGVILFELYHPFGTGVERGRKLKGLKGGTPDSNVAVEFPKASSLVKQLMALDPTDRPSAKYLLELHIDTLLED